MERFVELYRQREADAQREARGEARARIGLGTRKKVKEGNKLFKKSAPQKAPLPNLFPWLSPDIDPNTPLGRTKLFHLLHDK